MRGGRAAVAVLVLGCAGVSGCSSRAADPMATSTPTSGIAGPMATSTPRPGTTAARGLGGLGGPGTAAGGLGGDLASAAGGRAGVPRFAHVFEVVMENLGYSMALGTAGFSALARHFASATDYWAVAHPSLPNYLALTSGGTWGITSDCTSCYVSRANLGSQLSAAHISWGAYLEGLPSTCYLGPYAGGGYAGKHDPWRYYDNIRASRALCSHLRPYPRLAPLLSGPGAKVPAFVWITPNICNDGHDCPPSVAATWLQGLVASVTASVAWRDHGVLFVTWDESESGGARGGQVLTLVISPDVAAGRRVGTYYTCYSLLATIEDAFGLPLLGHAASATPMAALFSKR